MEKAVRVSQERKRIQRQENFNKAVADAINAQWIELDKIKRMIEDAKVENKIKKVITRIKNFPLFHLEKNPRRVELAKP